MEQTIPAVAGKTEMLSLNFMAPEKTLAVFSKAKEDNNAQSGADEIDFNALAPFLKLLKNQMMLHLNKDKSSAGKVSAGEQEVFKNEINTVEQGALIMIQLETLGKSYKADEVKFNADEGFINQDLPLSMKYSGPADIKQITGGLSGENLQFLAQATAADGKIIVGEDGMFLNGNLSGPADIKQITGGLSGENLQFLAQATAADGKIIVGEDGMFLNGNLSGQPDAGQNNNIRRESVFVPAGDAFLMNKSHIASPSAERELMASGEKSSATSLSAVNTDDEKHFKEAPVEKYLRDKGQFNDEEKLLKKNNDVFITAAEGKIKIAGNGKSLPESVSQLPPGDAEKLSFSKNGQEKGEKEKFNNVSENNLSKKDILQENAYLKTQEKNPAGNNSFINRISSFSNIQNNGLEKTSFAAGESQNLNSDDLLNISSAKENGVQNSGKQKNSSTVAQTDNQPITKMEEAIQAHRSDGREKIKLDVKNKIGPAENTGEANSFTSLTAAGTAAGRLSGIVQTSSSDLVNQVAYEIKDRAQGDGGRVKMVLNPPSLGTLEMDVLVINGKVKVVLTANNKDVQQILNGQLDNLKAILQSSGLTVERCDVLMRDKQDENYRFLGNSAYFQEKSGQGNEEKRKGSDEEKLPSGTYGEKRKTSIGNVTGTEQISLFA